MSNYSSLKSAIDANIKANGRREITGPVLNAILNAVVNSLGDGYLFRGVAIPSTNPGTPDQNVAYLAITEGTYTHMGGLSVTDGELSVFSYNGAWSKIPLALVPTKTSQLDNDLRFVTSEEMGESLSSKQDTIQDLSEIRSGAALGSTAYQKPSAGIPASDMTETVQQAISFAESTEKRSYNSSNPDGMGYLVLKKNKTFAEQVTEANTIYEIRYDFDLNNASVTIPSGCVLRFNGGRILDGEITFTNTRIEANSEVFVNIIPFGSVKGLIRTTFFSNINTEFYALSFFLNCGAEQIIFSEAESYTVTRGITVSNLHGVLDFNGCVFQYTQNDGGIFITLSNCSSLQIKNGTFIGTQDTRTTDTQYSHGLAITPSCHDIEIANCSFSKFAGDCIYISGMESAQGDCVERIEIHNCKFGNCVRQQIAIISCIGISIHDCEFYKSDNENVLYTNTSLASIDIEPNESYQINKDIHIYGNTMSSKTTSAWELLNGVSIASPNASVFENIDIHDNFMSNMYGAFVTITSSISAEILVHDNVFADHSQSNAPASHGGVVPNVQNYAFTLSRNTKFFNNYVKNVKTGAGLILFYSPSSETEKKDIQNCIFSSFDRLSVDSCHFRGCIFENSSIIAGSINKTIFDNCLFNGITFTAISTVTDSVFNDCSFDGCTSTGTIFTPTRTSFKRCNFNGGLSVAYITQQCSFSNCYFNLSGVTGTVIDRTALDGLQYYCNITECVFEITESSFARTIISDGIRSGSSNHAPLRMGDNTVKVKEGVVLNAVNWTLFNVPSDAQIDTVRMVNFPSYSQVSQTWGVNAMTIIISEKSKGSTASRPTNKIVGFQYFDTDLGKMIVWNGTAWVNMDGTILS